MVIAMLYQSVAALGLAQSGQATMPPTGGSLVATDVAAEQAWLRLAPILTKQRGKGASGDDGKPAGGGTDSSGVVADADQLKKFYQTFPGAPEAIAARKFEALLLIEAVAEGETAPSDRMEAVVGSVRKDLSMPPDARAEIAATYEFYKARQQVKSADDLPKVYEGVARALMQEFPDQPQGPGSLVTLADGQGDAHALAVSAEVVNSSAPADVKKRAVALANRVNAKGKSVQVLFGKKLDDTTGKSKWIPNRPGIIYVWSASNPASIAVAQVISARNLSRINIVGISLDTNIASATAIARDNQLPGLLLFSAAGVDDALLTALGALEAPQVYLVTADGNISDVRALDNLAAKLDAISL